MLHVAGDRYKADVVFVLEVRVSETRWQLSIDTWNWLEICNTIITVVSAMISLDSYCSRANGWIYG